MSLQPNALYASGGEQGTAADSGDGSFDLRFSSLEFQLEQISSMADRITRKHWPRAEKEQYPFWICIIIIALFGVIGWVIRNISYFGLYIALFMLIFVTPVIIYHLKMLSGRFLRQWGIFSTDGELFRFLRDASLMLGYPVDLGKPDEHFTTHLEIPFSDATSAIVVFLKASALPDPTPSDSPPGLKIHDLEQISPANSETHHVFQAEYFGSISRAFSIRVSALDAGSDVTVGFTMRTSNAETRDKLVESLSGRLQDRFIASKILASIREIAGVEPVSVPAGGIEEQQIVNHATSRVI
ncbi:MAG: hypothetical protein NTY09_12985 [bacterium]|nr:hypothetical protein [bacterium]